MADYSEKIISYLKQKIGNNWETTQIGTAPRYIKSLRNTTLNNLEELLLIGADTYTETYKDADDNTIIEKSFKPEGALSGDEYYKLVTVIYGDGSLNLSFYFYDPDLPNEKPGVYMTDLNGSTVKFGNGSVTLPDENTLYFLDSSIFSFDGDQVVIYPPDAVKIQEDVLWYIIASQQPEQKIKVITKTTSAGFTSDRKEIVKENLINHLK